MFCTYIGTDSRMYMDYRDASTGQVLEVTPGGGPYDVEVASGQAEGLPPVPADDRWAVTIAGDDTPGVPLDFAAEPEPATPVSTEAAEPAEQEN